MNKVVLLATTALLFACGDKQGSSSEGSANGARDGVQEHIVLSSKVDEADISFEFFEPDTVVAGERYPLVLQGHGYGGSRETARDGFVARLTEAGYYVISIDQRGFGESGGSVRGMSPDFEGQDLVQILDWAEDLPQLARRSNGDMLVGAYGGSYGGGYQFILYATDPQHRLRVLAPDITWHNLAQSLGPNEVVKSGWGLALAAGGEQGSSGNQDMAIREALLSAVQNNRFDDSSRNFFAYHGLNYFCEGQPPGEQNFLLATPDPMLVPPLLGPPVDALITQGMRDTLFNFNQAARNYDCLRNLGGDVRLLTHESGHILPVGPQTAGLEEPLDAFYAALTLPNFQDDGGPRNCGPVNLNDLQFAWFEEKLKGLSGSVNAVLSTGAQICMSLATDDAVAMPQIQRGGTSFELDASIPQFNGVVAAGGALLGSGASEALLATQPLFTAPAEGAVLAGIPLLEIELAGLSGLEMTDCPLPGPLQTGCDPILLLGVGHRQAGNTRWDLVDDQLTPIRGFGSFAMEMTGIAERLAEGDELALLVYGFHAQYPVTWSRDVFVPALSLSGSLALPVLGPSALTLVQ